MPELLLRRCSLHCLPGCSLLLTFPLTRMLLLRHRPVQSKKGKGGKKGAAAAEQKKPTKPQDLGEGRPGACLFLFAAAALRAFACCECARL